MTTWLEKFNLEFHPLAHQTAMVYGPHTRFTILTSRLIRLEYNPGDRFEDRPSQVFWHRQQPLPEFQVSHSLAQIDVTTAHLHLRYRPGPHGFRPDTLSIELRELGTVWHFGDHDRHNLRGTTRTLDGADGAVDLEPGLMSRSGWAVVDDSASLVFDDRGWLVPRPPDDCLDLYFWGYGHDYLACLHDFYHVTGPVPLIPRWALGNWWSRYWEYSDGELLQVMDEFEARGIPLSVCIVDMDWHITDTGNASSGWTGYTWNRELFPDPEAFLQELHQRGLHVALNLHPADGVYPHEATYPAMTRQLGLDPASGEPVPFNIADPNFAAAYLNILHHPLEAQGVDFWWIDWQQGTRTDLTGLDPLWWLNHLHFYDLGRGGHKRPAVLSRWGGLGSHRYPLGFSGDTNATWATLAFQPYFTATAANAGYGWWSHDIGGHMHSVEDEELYTRWVQLGVLSPILRLHSTKNPYLERRPWGYDAETFRLTKAAMCLRQALVPYLYFMAWYGSVQGRPLILPMYYVHSETEEAYHCPGQYYFGTELIAAPHTAPRDADTRLSRQAIWLPAGDWFDFMSGEHYAGGRWHTRYGTLDDIPLLARAGAIVPLDPAGSRGANPAPGELTVHVFAGADNTFDLYEDDGQTQAHRQGHYALTPLRLDWHGHELEFTIGPAGGDLDLLPAQRTYHLVLHGLSSPDEVHLSLNGSPQPVTFAYDEQGEALALHNLTASPVDTLRLSLAVPSGTLLSRRDRRLETCRALLRAFRLDSTVKYQIDRHLPDILAGRLSLMNYSHDLKDTQLAALTSVLDHRL